MNGARSPAGQTAAQALVVAALGVALHFGWVEARWALAGFAALVLAWPPRVPWRPLPAAAVVGRYLVFALAWLVFVVVYLRAMHNLGWTVSPQPMLQQLAEQGVHQPGFVTTCLAIVVLAPVAEELAFRGYLFTALRDRLPELPSQLLTAAMFGAVHGGGYALPIGVLGLFFGWLRARYGALLPSILAHGLHNGITVLVTVAWPGHLELLYPR